MSILDRFDANAPKPVAAEATTEQESVFGRLSRRSFLGSLAAAGISATTVPLAHAATAALGRDSTSENGAHVQPTASMDVFPSYLQDDFDFVNFTQFDVASPPMNLIYQSNGYLALQEQGFGAQKVMVPVVGGMSVDNTNDRLSAVMIEAPVVIDSSSRIYNMSNSPGVRSISYFADRTVYRTTFDSGPEVWITVYPVYGKAAAVIKVRIIKAQGELKLRLRIKQIDFRSVPSHELGIADYGLEHLPYRILMAGSSNATVDVDTFNWDLRAGDLASLVIGVGGSDEGARTVVEHIQSSPDLYDLNTHSLWNKYLASTPLVAPADSVKFKIGTSGKHEHITPEELVRSQLWFWRGLLNTTCQVKYLPATPIPIADWNVFMGMWSNDGIAESISLAATDRRDLARSAILSWFRYAVNVQGDGTCPWTIFPSGRDTFQAYGALDGSGAVRVTQGVPVQATLVGEYVRLTGDTSVLDEKPGGAAGGRTVWEALVAYQRNLRRVRDPNNDHLIDWLHIFETGWDDKDSPFVDLKGHATSAINEQVFNLWSLQEMIYLSNIRDEDPLPWEKEFSRVLEVVRRKLWDPTTHRYWDLDVDTDKLWTRGENLDAYYFLYFETDPARIEPMMQRLNDPAKFNGPLLPTLAYDTPNWGGYWRGAAWPRIISYVALALSRSGHVQEGFTWLARAINSNLGPILPEHLDSMAYPPREHILGSVRIMGHDAIDTLVFGDIAGLQTWGGKDLTVAPSAELGKLYVRGQKWMGDRYDAIFSPGHPSRLWRNGRPLEDLATDRVWRAKKKGYDVIFEPIS